MKLHNEQVVLFIQIRFLFKYVQQIVATLMAAQFFYLSLILKNMQSMRLETGIGLGVCQRIWISKLFSALSILFSSGFIILYQYLEFLFYQPNHPPSDNF